MVIAYKNEEGSKRAHSLASRALFQEKASMTQAGSMALSTMASTVGSVTKRRGKAARTAQVSPASRKASRNPHLADQNPTRESVRYGLGQ